MPNLLGFLQFSRICGPSFVPQGFLWYPDTELLYTKKSTISNIKFYWLSHQCGTNIRIFKYIQIYLDKYIHLSKYSLTFSKANIIMIYSYWQMYSDIHLSNIYNSKYIWFFNVSQKKLKMVWYGPKIKQNMKMAKIVQNNHGQIIIYSNIFVHFGWIYSFAKIFIDFFLIKFIRIFICEPFFMPNIFRYSLVQYLW